MSRRSVYILLVAALLLSLVAGAFCVEYFVLQTPVFDRSGWYTTQSGEVQYRDYYARPMTGWLKLDGQQYYFSEDGSMHIGWLESDGQRYYFQDNGAMHTGWLEKEGKRYFLKQDGMLYTGWLEADGKRCYLDTDGVLRTGWLELAEGTYLLDEEGAPITGWVIREGKRCYLAENGVLDERWQDTEQGLTYVENGEKHIGWLDVPQGKFYFKEDGVAHTGWVTDETGRFYLYGDGTYATGFVEINGTERYFLPTGEYVILCNRWNPVPEDFEMNLVSIGKFKMDATCAGAMEEMMEAAKADGVTLKINNSYRSKNTQQSMWETRRIKYMGQGMTLSEADAYIGRSVAVPGTSEHQTGLAVDIKGSQKVYTWLAENSWKFGFILRYPDNKIKITGILFEPWHFRYVGKTMAKDVFDSGLCLEEYMEALKQSQ